jgi:hypothetical protein
MPCIPFTSDDGKTSGFICTRGRQPRAKCFYCSKPHDRLCDAKVSDKRTCDRKLCTQHARRVAPERDLCPDHDTREHRGESVEPKAARAPLQLFTGNCNRHRKDPDAFDVTIMTGGPDGRPFAPSTEIFQAVQKARAQVTILEGTAAIEESTQPETARARREKAERIRKESWAIYRRAFLAEMLVSSDRDVPEDWKVDVTTARARGVVARPEAWTKLLSRRRVVLLCYCDGRDLCHRGLLVQVLAKMGAEDRGELPVPEKNPGQAKLFGEGK